MPSVRRWQVSAALVAVLLSGMAGCAKQYPSNYPRSTYSRSQLTGEASATTTFTPPPRMQAKIDLLVHEAYPPPWTWSDSDRTSEPAKDQLLKGQQLYQKHCVHCHGIAGGGDGPTAASLIPRPRDFRRGIYKWKSTSSRAKPTRADLLSILHEGAMGTSMPPFNLMPKDQLEAITDYIVYLSKRGELERELLLLYSQEGPTAEELAASKEALSDEDAVELEELLVETAEEKIEALDEAWESAEDAIAEPEEMELPQPGTSEFEESVARGKQVYLGSNAGCTKCHGADGHGRADLTGNDALDLWGYSNPPRDLTLGLFRGGRQPIDIYHRIHEGIAGSSMPGQGANPKVSKQDIWDLVNFVRVLPTRPELLATEIAGGTEKGASHP